MKAIVVYEAGGTAQLIYQDIDRPILKNDELLVKVKAIGINAMDPSIRSAEQLLTAFLGAERPAILGWDISGEVVEKGTDVQGFEIGDAVFALTNGRSYAAYVAVRAKLTVLKPEHISFEEAAAVPVAAITAWEALQLGNVKKGDTVLIHAGSGGVGHFAIQLAKNLGARVIATSSAKNREFILSLGADQHIDYQTEHFNEVLSDLDFVLDPIGGETLEKSIDIVKKNGQVVSIVPPLPENLLAKARERGVNLSLMIAQGSKEGMNALAQMLSENKLKAHVTAVYSFAQMADAHQAMESKRTVGKIVVQV